MKTTFPTTTNYPCNGSAAIPARAGSPSRSKVANGLEQVEREGVGEIDERENKKYELKVSGAEHTIQPLLKAQIISFISEQQCIDRKQDIFQPDKPYWTK